MCYMYFEMSMNKFAKMMLVPSFKLNFKIQKGLMNLKT